MHVDMSGKSASSGAKAGKSPRMRCTQRGYEAAEIVKGNASFSCREKTDIACCSG
jgi:hypothetical protein